MVVGDMKTTEEEEASEVLLSCESVEIDLVFGDAEKDSLYK